MSFDIRWGHLIYLVLRGAVAYEQKKFYIAVNYLQMCYFYNDKKLYENFLPGSSYLYKKSKEYDKAYLYLDFARKRGYKLSDRVKTFMSELETNHNTNPLFS